MAFASLLLQRHSSSSLLSILVLAIAIAIVCAADQSSQEGIPPPASSVSGPFTNHFQKWLQESKYSSDEFASAKLGPQASYGGKHHDAHPIKFRPVIFIHGNSDGALANGKEEWAQGWSASIEHFLTKGYTTAELYAITYGDRDLSNSLKRSMDCKTLRRIRRFVEAVKAYTGAEKVDIIAHSMGVTLARHAIQGGAKITMKRHKRHRMHKAGGAGEFHVDDDCALGAPMQQQVHTLIGIAGANYGLCICADEKLAQTAAACSKSNGFWTSSGCSDAHIGECSHQTPPNPERAHCHSNGQYARMLHKLNRPTHPKDAHFVVSIWSNADAILGPTNFAWGRLTSLIPNSDHSAIYTNQTHYSLKWMTVEDQFGFLAAEQFPRIESQINNNNSKNK